jgi:phosphoenolpyruvate carboxykinase (GTP)
VGRASAIESALGWMPEYRDLSWSGLSMSEKQFNALMSVDTSLALQDVASIAQHFEQFRKGDRLPIEMDSELILLDQRLKRRS